MGATPMTFMCPKAREQKNTNEWRRRRGDAPDDTPHHVERTGRTKPNRSNNRSSRALGTSWEYRCSCGHVGWSVHAGVLQRPLAADYDRTWQPIGTIPVGGGRVTVRKHFGAGFESLNPPDRDEHEISLDRHHRFDNESGYTEWRPAR